MASPLQAHYDVVIAGGGPAGSSLAIRLATSGASVLLAEQKLFPRQKLCGEFISPECLTHFAALGVLDQMMEPRGARLTDTIFYSAGGRATAVPSAWFGNSGGAALGLSRAEMDARLLRRARAVGVEVHEETTVGGLISEGQTVRGVRLKSSGGAEHEVHSALTVDATGRGRSLARRWTSEAGGPPREETGRAPFVAFKAHLTGARVDPAHCEIYVYRGGYGGLNAIEGGLFNHCFIVRADLVRRHDNDAERVMHEIVMTNRRARQTLADAHPVSPWLAVALPWYGARELVPAHGLITIGDAAAFIDPFTGSGMLLALESAEVAGQAIVQHQRNGFDLAEFEREYRAAYAQRFRARLRVSRWLRYAAFVPGLAAVLVSGLGMNPAVRRRLARATRGGGAAADLTR